MNNLTGIETSDKKFYYYCANDFTLVYNQLVEKIITYMDNYLVVYRQKSAIHFIYSKYRWYGIVTHSIIYPISGLCYTFNHVDALIRKQTDPNNLKTLDVSDIIDYFKCYTV